MKRSFTKLLAALALLTFLAVPMGMWGQTTYEQLTSIANIDEDAQYVLGIDGTGFHYSNTSGWGLTGLPEEHTPYYYRLVVAADGQSFKAYIDTPIYGNTYYMTIPTSNAFTMTTSSDAANTDLIIGTTCTGVSTPNYAVANKTTTARHLRRNGSSGLRSYAGTTGSIAYFYKVVTSSGPVQLDAPTLTATPSNEKVTLTWNSINGASSYTIQYADNTSFTGATTITNATSPKEISGLTNGTTYYFKAMSVGDGSDYLSSDYGTVVSSTPANVVTITITQDAIVGFTNVYNWYDWSVSDISGKLYAYKSGGMQFNSSKTAYWIYNTTAVPGNITSVKMTKASGTDRSWTLKAGNSAMTTTSDGTQIGNVQTVGTSGATWNVSGDYNYFLLYVSGGSTVISSIEITYTPTSSSEPSITADDVEIAYDATSGEIEYTLTNPATNGSLSVSENVDWISNAVLSTTESKVTFTTTANEANTPRDGVITITYSYGNNETVSKNVTITQAAAPVIYSTIPALFAAATTTETSALVTFNNWVVSGVSNNGKSVFVTDNNGNGFVIYYNSDMSSTYAAGNILSGTAVSCTLKKYNGFAEIINVDANDLTITTGGIVTVANVAMANLAGVNTGALLHYEGLTCSVDNNKYYLSDGTTTLQVYNAIYAFDALEDGETYNITGIYQQYNNTKEILPRSAADIVKVVIVEPSITVDPDEVSVDAEEHDGTLDLTYENLTITEMGDFDIQYYDAVGTETSEPDWIEVLVAEQDPEIGEGYVVSYYMFENEGIEARTAYFKVFALGDEDFVYSNLVTITQAAPVVPPTPGNWVLTNLADLTEDDIFVIVGTDADDDTFALPNDGGASTAPLATAITIVESTISGEPAVELQWNLSGNATDGYIFYPNGTTETWLYCTNANNGVRVGTNANKTFNIDEDGYMVNDATSRVLSIYVNNGTPQDWRCYSNYNNNPVVISFYKKVVEPVTETYTLTIDGYTDVTEGTNNKGYYLIASPVTVDPSTVDGMAENDFDLYYFDQSAEDEWRNYEASNFSLVPGKGYLYAKKGNDTYNFTLTGTPYVGNGEVRLSKDTGAEFAGHNLVGNPFGVDAYITKSFYTLENSDEYTPHTAGTAIHAMQGLFVVANEDGETLTFSTEAPVGKVAKLNMNVSKGRNTIDQAIVSFNEGQQLPKLQFRNGSTKVYIPKEGKDYAIVSAESGMGEMPVNFKAENNGTYTLSFTSEEVSFSYLHLVDNMTGADIDLLATPSYSFEARTTDYANRFKLSFKANTGVEENATSTFAYYNGSAWNISNMGEATLQVIDMMGRVLSSETISGNVSISLNQPAGVYMLRLVNGENVMVQKVVVR